MRLNRREKALELVIMSKIRVAYTRKRRHTMSVTNFSRCFGGAASPKVARSASDVRKLFMTSSGAIW
jgi:hypothetical protein